jgi:hypothetical protein
VLQPNQVPMANILDGSGGIRDVGLVLVPLLDPEVVVLVFVCIHRHLAMASKISRLWQVAKKRNDPCY